MTDDKALLHAEIKATLIADMKTDLADLVDRGVQLTPEVLRRLKDACAASVASLAPGCDVEVDAERCEVRIVARDGN